VACRLLLKKSVVTRHATCAESREGGARAQGVGQQRHHVGLVTCPCSAESERTKVTRSARRRRSLRCCPPRVLSGRILTAGSALSDCLFLQRRNSSHKPRCLSHTTIKPPGHKHPGHDKRFREQGFSCSRGMSHASICLAKTRTHVLIAPHAHTHHPCGSIQRMRTRHREEVSLNTSLLAKQTSRVTVLSSKHADCMT
jgi:hypothetical protein